MGSGLLVIMIILRVDFCFFCLGSWGCGFGRGFRASSRTNHDQDPAHRSDDADCYTDIISDACC